MGLHYDDIRNFAFGFEHFEHFIAEQLFKLNGIRWRAYHEGVIIVKAAIGAENMKMRMKILKIAKRLNGDRSTGFGIVIGYGLSQIKIQHFLSEP